MLEPLDLPLTSALNLCVIRQTPPTWATLMIAFGKAESRK